jgi:hypothetical protein
MKNEAEFKAFYNETILPALNKLVAEKNKTIAFKRFAIIGSIVLLAVINIPFWMKGAAGLTIPLSIIFGYLAYRALVYRSIGDYEYDFKDKITRHIITFFNKDMAYDPDLNVLQSAFEISNIYQNLASYYVGTDLVKGSIGQTDIQFSWLKVDQGGNFNIPIFKGIFFIANFNKYFDGETYVIPRYIHDKIGKIIDEAAGDRPPLVTLENPDFEHDFIVYSSDPVEARYILTPAMMDKMVAINKKTTEDICFSFVREYMFVAISVPEDIFGPPDTNDYGFYKKLYTYLDLTFSIVDDFELNTRIWGRED